MVKVLAKAILNRPYLGRFDLAYCLAIIILGLDQVTKHLIERVLEPYGSGKTLSVAGGLVLRYYRNSGASNNIVAGSSWLVVLLVTLIVTGLIFYYQRASSKDIWFKTGIGLLLGGALGNLSDRLLKQGFVTDFIHIGWLPFLKTFNLADLAVRGGLVILMITVLWQNGKYQAGKILKV